MTGPELKHLLKVYDLTQQEAADLLGISRQTLSTWCKLAIIPESDFLLISAKIGQNVKTESKGQNNSNAKAIAIDDVILLNVPLVQEYAYAGYMSGYSDLPILEIKRAHIKQVLYKIIQTKSINTKYSICFDFFYNHSIYNSKFNSCRILMTKLLNTLVSVVATCKEN